MKHILFSILVALTIQAANAQVDTVYNADSSNYYLLQHYNTTPVSINIPPLIEDNTIIMRKARTFVQSMNQVAKTVAVSVDIIRYSFKGSNFTDTSYIDDSNYGSVIEDGVKKSIEIIASNTTLVNPATGAINRNSANGDTVMGQYDFFFMLADNQPIVLNELIKQYLQANADWK